MTETDDRYFECPECNWAISFKFDYDKWKYVSTCPYCKNVLEIEKEEFEKDNIEIYFKADF